MKKWISLSIVVLLLTGCEKLDQRTGELKRMEEETVIKVKTVSAYTVVENQEARMLETAGVVMPKQELGLSFGTSGKIASILVQKGASVKAGQTLATLDQSSLQAGIQAAAGQVASANIRRSKALSGPESHEIQTRKLQVEKAKELAAKAEREYAQATVLFANGAIAKDELDRLALAQKQAKLSLEEEEIAYNKLMKGADRLDVEEAQVGVSQANVQLSRAKQEAADAVLKAPFSGVVAAVSQLSSEQTGPGSEVIRLVDTSSWIVKLQVDSEQIGLWQTGATVQVKSADGSEAEGKVTFVSPVMDQNVGAYPVEVTVDGSAVNWKGGMTVTCHYPVAGKNAPIVPVASIGISDEEYYVMKIKENTVEKTPVKVGALHGTFYEVLEGLEPGDQIVGAGLSYVVDGEAVKVADE
ncbi:MULTISPECIES: efflux RND transporter periplasmic adaptor subunit [Brevibacillus]|uniref:efflux RND transporter periplasmic adaptor subunit n=1 Tax=Brevibacillus TaxID=55080 RepID=UPI00156AF6C4|nr:MULTISPECIES: efflux RND transporter periplasmic adaptor subunit [Brevibacillus]MBU8713873.1 efflux RND transporter periplasmic adaptor subunit [Brevibacillus parabrevis]UED68332.1 efflux RND transporter periplasmic adaptor subunit [Brevibacillus sp. HD3.3A]